MTPDDVRLRQQLLLIRSTELRHVLIQDLQCLQRPAAWCDQIKAGWHWLAQHPEWPTAGVVLLLILKPRRFLTWTGRAWWLWKSARQLRRLRDAMVLKLSQIRSS